MDMIMNRRHRRYDQNIVTQTARPLDILWKLQKIPINPDGGLATINSSFVWSDTDNTNLDMFL